MQLSGMLINAEEQERSRVASELHDDFSQRLAILALGIESADEATPSSLPDLHKQLRELISSISELGADLHTLSHRLHSSTIESLGLVPALTALCKEFTRKQGICHTPYSRRHPSIRSTRHIPLHLSNRSRSSSKCEEVQRCHAGGGGAANDERQIGNQRARRRPWIRSGGSRPERRAWDP